jgi:hypothetical protein
VSYYDSAILVAESLANQLDSGTTTILNMLHTDSTYGIAEHSKNSTGTGETPGFDVKYTMNVMKEWIEDRTHDDKDPSWFIVNFQPLRAFIALRAREVRAQR